VVDPHHLRPSANQLGSIKPRAARRIKDPFAGHISQQRQAGRPVIASVVETALGVIEELIGEYVILRLTSYIAPNVRG
jgi:hypothetical protein